MVRLDSYDAALSAASFGLASTAVLLVDSMISLSNTSDKEEPSILHCYRGVPLSIYPSDAKPVPRTG
jgi:hypothetical protein